MKRFAYWMIWVTVLCVMVAYHFGPGQKPVLLERAAAEVRRAEAAQEIAKSAHAAAMISVQAKIDAKKRADETKSPADIEAARAAIQVNDEAWKQTRSAWQAVADAFGLAESLAGQAQDVNLERELRLRRNHAMIGAGKMFAAAGDLEAMVKELTDGSSDAESLMRRARAEIGAAYFQGARAMRLEGDSEADWRAASSKARQLFRHLAETSSSDGDRAQHQANLEVVLNLEQSTFGELEATPSPNNCKGSCDKQGPRPAKQPKKRNDGNPGSHIEDVPLEGS